MIPQVKQGSEFQGFGHSPKTIPQVVGFSSPSCSATGKRTTQTPGQKGKLRYTRTAWWLFTFVVCAVAEGGEPQR